LLKELVVEASVSPALVNADPSKTRRWLMSQMHQNEFHDVDIDAMVKVKGFGQQRTIDYDYEVKRPLFRNINYVMRFSGSS